MKNVCIIGGAGFIGRHLVKRFTAMGWNVTVIGRQQNPGLAESVTYLQSRNEKGFFTEAFEGIDYVIELAYSTTPKTSFDNPVQDIFDNLTFSVTVFEALLKSNVNKIVSVSSGGTVYGQMLQSPITEEHPTNPISPYGITKLAIEKYGNMYHRIQKLPVVIVRPSNAYGEGQIPFRGQGFISTAIGTALQGGKVNVYGNPGTIRDYIHVDDLVCGIIAALEKGIFGECYNIGTGIGRSNFEIIKTIDQILRPLSHEMDYEVLGSRPFDVVSNILDSSKLEKMSGWKPEVDFETGLRRTVAWLLKEMHN